MLKKFPIILTVILSTIPLIAQTIVAPGGGGDILPKTDSPLAKQLTGEWSWGGDREEYDGKGNGTYWRANDVCYKFTYSVKNDIVHTSADRNHSCGATRENDWRIRVADNIMYKQHTGSGFQTEWKREAARTRISGTLEKQIIGKWKWGTTDVKVFYPNGKGEQWRDEKACGGFTYSINGDMVKTTSDRKNHCQEKLENDWKIRVVGNTLYQQHAVSGFETEWIRIE